VKAGAFGFSTSRTISHKTKKGDLTPTLRAEEHELTSIAQGMAGHGPRLIQMVSDWNTPDPKTEFGMLRRAVESTGCRALISVNQRHDRPMVWRELMQMCRSAVVDGLSIRPIVAPRSIGVIFSLQSTQNPFSGAPSYIAIAGKLLAERVKIMRDPEFKRQLLSEDRVKLSTFPVLARTSFERMFRYDHSNYTPGRTESISAIAQRAGRTPEEVAYDTLLEMDGREMLFCHVVNYYDFNSDACREMIADPNAVIGLSDGGAHVGFVCDASFPTYFLTYWARDKKVFELQNLIRRHTCDNARAIGLFDRGTVERGMRADLNVVDVDQLGMEYPYLIDDLPANGLRLMQRARGYEATMVSGQLTYRDGVAQGNLPGRVVRGPQVKPN
jgi:N-acyl-D-aspartate/D-glutamate deacylase